MVRPRCYSLQDWLVRRRGIRHPAGQGWAAQRRGLTCYHESSPLFQKCQPFGISGVRSIKWPLCAAEALLLTPLASLLPLPPPPSWYDRDGANTTVTLVIDGALKAIAEALVRNDNADEYPRDSFSTLKRILPEATSSDGKSGTSHDQVYPCHVIIDPEEVRAVHAIPPDREG
jgi:hypothetical protein